MSPYRSTIQRLVDTLRHPAFIFSRKQNGCDTCEFPARDGEGIVCRRSLETWIAAARHCYFFGLVVAVLGDSKAKHGVDPSAGGRSEIYLSGAHPNNQGGRFCLKWDRDYINIEDDTRTLIVFYKHLGLST